MRLAARIVGLALAALVLLPLLFLLFRAVLLASEGHAQVLVRPATGWAVLRTLALALSVGVTCVLVSLPLAWWTHACDLPCRRFFRVTLNLPLAVPSYVSGFFVLVLLGPTGWVQELLAPFGIERLPDISGGAGAFVALLFCFPFALLSLQGALAHIDPRLWEAARSLGMCPRRAFIAVVLPKLRPAMASGGLLVGLYALGDFGAVSLLRYESLSYLIYLRYRSLFDRHEAIYLALILVLLAGLSVFWLRRLGGRPTAALSALGERRTWPVIRLGRWRWFATLCCLTTTLLGVVLPVVVVAIWLLRGLSLQHAIVLPVRETLTSLGLGVLACVIIVSLALVPALMARLGAPRTAGLIRGLAHAGYALPGIVVALALVFLAVTWARPLYQTITLLMLAYAIRFLPLGVDSLSDAFAGQNPRLYDAARGLGASPTRAVSKVLLPNIRPAIWTALLAIFIAVVKELPATLLLSPIELRALSTRIWSLTADAFYSATAPAVLILLLLAGIALALRPDIATRH